MKLLQTFYIGKKMFETMNVQINLHIDCRKMPADKSANTVSSDIMAISHLFISAREITTKYNIFVLSWWPLTSPEKNGLKRTFPPFIPCTLTKAGKFQFGLSSHKGSKYEPEQIFTMVLGLWKDQWELYMLFPMNHSLSLLRAFSECESVVAGKEKVAVFNTLCLYSQKKFSLRLL